MHGAIPCSVEAHRAIAGTVNVRINTPISSDTQSFVWLSTRYPYIHAPVIVTRVPSEFLQSKPAINKCECFRRLVIWHLAGYQLVRRGKKETQQRETEL